MELNGSFGKAGYWLGMVLLVFALGTAAAGAEPELAGLARVELDVSSLDTSMRFYGSLFGSDAWQRSADGRAWLPIGSAYLVLTESERVGIRRPVFSVSAFDGPALGSYLESQRLSPVADEAGLLSVRDGDGIVSALGGAGEPGVTLLAAPQPAQPQVAVFSPLLLDEVHVMVSNLEVDSLFYSRLLGHTASQQAGSLWYPLGQGRLRLSQAPPGQQAGINYFSVLVANTDMQLASERVFAAGGLVETELSNGFSFWDPDGLRVLVRSTTQH